MKHMKFIGIFAIALAIMSALAGCKTEAPVQTPQPVQSAAPAVVNVYEAEEKQLKVITVNGSGKAVLQPDIATVYIEVTTENTEADKAQEENSMIMAAITETLAANGVEEKDIVTEYINLDQRYDYKKSPAQIVGYTMSNTVKVTIKDIDAVGKVIADAVAAGATGTYGLAFSVSSGSEGYGEALKNATKDAAIKAQAIAAALGVDLEAEPVSVNEQSNSYTPYIDDVRSTNDLAAPATEPEETAAPAEISIGELEVNARVSVTYAIETPQN